ncbi:MAG: toll/interleukin-1 receptor domain-containing protein, partial [Bacteroidota bacterium]
FHIYKKKSLESLINFIDIGCKQYGLVIPPIRDHYMLAEELTPDVFISYNSQDRLFVHETANRLSKRGIESWIDDRELTPGDDWYDEFERLLPSISSVVIFIGKNGRGRWQEEEIKIFKDEEVQRKLSSEKLRLMVVALKDYDDDRNKFPAFLRSKIFIDCRQVSDYVDRLTRGITSINPFKE